MLVVQAFRHIESPLLRLNYLINLVKLPGGLKPRNYHMSRTSQSAYGKSKWLIQQPRRCSKGNCAALALLMDEASSSGILYSEIHIHRALYEWYTV